MKLQQTIPRLLTLYALGFAVVLGQLGYWKLVRGDELAGHPRNPRFQARQNAVQRGRVVTADEVVVADSERVGGDDPRGPSPPEFRRVQPRGDAYAHIVGYSSKVRGATALERNLDRWLSGRAAPAVPRDLWDLLDPPPVVGDQVTLTIRDRVQRAAIDALGRRRGAVVALDVRTGAILALADQPRYDPNRIDDDWAAIVADEDKPLLARAYQGRYPPGSVFKVITAAGALDAGVVTPDTPYVSRGTLRLPHSTVRDREPLGNLTLTTAISKSSNIALAQVALALGPSGFESLLRRQKLDAAPRIWHPGDDFDGLVAPGRFPVGEALTPQELAACGYGQGALEVTPLGVASIGQMLGNGGRRLEPYLVESITGPDGAARWRHRPEAGESVVSATAASSVVAMMRAVMAPGGTASHLRVRGLAIAGKTGSAQNPHGRAHSWFLALAPAEAPTVAVAAIVENGGAGGAAAGPAAIATLRAAMN